MISKILIWVGFSVMIICVCAVVAFAAVGLIGWAIASACFAVLLAFVCRRESDALNAWSARKQDREWAEIYRNPNP